MLAETNIALENKAGRQHLRQEHNTSPRAASGRTCTGNRSAVQQQYTSYKNPPGYCSSCMWDAATSSQVTHPSTAGCAGGGTLSTASCTAAHSSSKTLLPMVHPPHRSPDLLLTYTAWHWLRMPSQTHHFRLGSRLEYTTQALDSFCHSRPSHHDQGLAWRPQPHAEAPPAHPNPSVDNALLPGLQSNLCCD
jgi:hypothetical protein